jgi:hypothetical protein
MSERRIKITGGGDGMVHSTWQVLDAETGEYIKGVRRVEIIADARGVGEAVLYIGTPGLEVDIDALRMEERAEDLTAAERVASEVEKRVNERIAYLLRELRKSKVLL